MRAKFTALILMFVLGFVWTAQAKSAQTVQVKINNQKSVPKSNLTIKFAELVEDSRCPAGVQCIQAGEARIKIQIRTGKGAWKTFEISTNGGRNRVTFAGYTVRLADVAPHPATNIRIDRNGYTATFSVSGKK